MTVNAGRIRSRLAFDRIRPIFTDSAARRYDGRKFKGSIAMQDYWLLLAKLPFVVAALGWAVRELVNLNREEKRDAETRRGAGEEGSV